MSVDSKAVGTAGATGEGVRAVPHRRRDRPWRAIVFAPAGDGATRRRGSDGFRLGAAALIVLCCWLITKAPAHAQTAVMGAVYPPPTGVKWLTSAVLWAGSFGLMGVLGVLALISRRRNVIRDVFFSGGIAWVLSLGLELILGPNAAHEPSMALQGVNLGFPLARLTATVAVVTAALPYFSRSFQRLVELVVVLAAVATVVHGDGLPVSVLASAAIGWGVTAGLHLVVGSPLGLPSGSEVAGLLGDLGIDAKAVTATRHQVWGVARFAGADSSGPLEISVYGRDAHDAQLLAKTFRYLAYRDSGPTLTLTRVQQVEHEAYLTLMAERSGARVPAVLAAGTAGPAHDAVLVTRPPPGRRLADFDPDHDQLSDEAARHLLQSVLALRAAGIAHGAINLETVVSGPADTTGLVDFRSGTDGGTVERLDRDLAAALSTLALVIGSERTVAVAQGTVPPDALAAALPYLQRAALGPVASHELRGRKAVLSELREQGAKAAGVEVPKLTEPRRISWVTLVLVLGTLIGGWALIGVLINVGKSWSTITGADWGWVAATFVLSQLAYPSLAVTTTGSVVDPLPYGRVVALEVSNSFVALAGGTMAVLATRVRFFQQDGYDATLAVSSGVVISTVSWIVKGAMFLIAVPIAFASFNFGTQNSDDSSSDGHLVWLIVIVVVVVMVALGIVLLVPRLRRLAKDKLRPKLSEVFGHLAVLAKYPRNMVEIFGGSVLAQLLIALALGTALHAFNEHLSLASLLIVLTLASMLGGISPVPGGMGVVEAGMILGLTAAGIPQDQAVAATFVQRLFTSYLPPIWGWFVLVWLRKKEYL